MLIKFSPVYVAAFGITLPKGSCKSLRYSRDGKNVLSSSSNHHASMYQEELFISRKDHGTSASSGVDALAFYRGLLNACVTSTNVFSWSTYGGI